MNKYSMQESAKLLSSVALVECKDKGFMVVIIDMQTSEVIYESNLKNEHAVYYIEDLLRNLKGKNK